MPLRAWTGRWTGRLRAARVRSSAFPESYCFSSTMVESPSPIELLK